MNHILSAILFLLTSCVHGPGSFRQISYRDPKSLQIKSTEEKKRLVQTVEEPSQKIVRISPILDRSSTGSLMNLDDDRNLFFMEEHPLKVGDTILVSILAPAKKDLPTSQQPKTPAQPASPAASAPKATSQDTKKDTSTDLTDLVKDFPLLEPPEKSENRVDRNIKMKIMSEFPNGDFRILYARSSDNELSKKSMTLEASISRSKAIMKKDITTDDLFDIRFTDASTTDLVQRSSSSWEDEYTLRVSGFSEEKSKYAQSLTEKQKQLESIKDKIQKDIQDLSKEKQMLAKERDDIIKEREATKTQISSLNDKVKESTDVIQQQKDTIKTQESELESLKNNASAEPKTKAPAAAPNPPKTPQPATASANKSPGSAGTPAQPAQPAKPAAPSSLAAPTKPASPPEALDSSKKGSST